MNSPLSIPIAIRQAADALSRGDIAGAAQLSKAIVAAKPETVEAWRILGKAANGLKHFALAEQAFGESERRRPAGSAERIQDLLARAEPLICLGRRTAAAICVREAVRLAPTRPHDLFLTALALSYLGLPAEALLVAEQAVALDPLLTDAWFVIGNMRQFLGEIDSAETAFDAVIVQSRDHAAVAYYALAHLRRWKPQHNHIRRLETFQCRSSPEAANIGHALFKEYDDIGDIDTAWDCLQHAARVGRAMERWDGAEEKRRFDAWKAAFSDQHAQSEDRRARTGPKRIFIVGLPRSGTTLVERILASHSEVQTIGESYAFPIAAHRVSSPDAPPTIAPTNMSPAMIAAARDADPLAIAADYTADTRYLGDNIGYTIDKWPNNFEYIGLIKRAFPDAIVIVLDRNPMDALFGAYKRVFAPGAYSWSYTLEDLAAHYDNFKSLVGRWKSVIGNGLIEISLETLIADPESEIRRLLQRCGLPFEESCLRPHEATGAVTTASALQVRRPINAQGVGAWKRYERQLQPLRERLVALGYDV